MFIWVEWLIWVLQINKSISMKFKSKVNFTLKPKPMPHVTVTRHPRPSRWRHVSKWGGSPSQMQELITICQVSKWHSLANHKEPCPLPTTINRLWTWHFKERILRKFYNKHWSKRWRKLQHQLHSSLKGWLREFLSEIDLKWRIASRYSRISNTSQGGLHHPIFEKYTTDSPQITKKFRSEELRQQKNCTHKIHQ